MTLAGVGVSKLDAESEQIVKIGINEIFQKLKPTAIISGVNQGFDMIFCEEAIRNNISVFAAMAYRKQGSKWPLGDYQRLKNILSAAREITYVNDDYNDMCFYERADFVCSKSNAVLAALNNRCSHGEVNRLLTLAAKSNRQIYLIEV